MKGRGRGTFGKMARAVAWICLSAFLAVASMAVPTLALDPVIIGQGVEHIEISKLGVFYEGRGERISVETAPDASEASSRVEFRAKVASANTNWFVFAIRNTTSQQIERWVTADRYSLIGSRFSLPELDSKKIESISRSYGFPPEQIRNDKADIFKILVEPGQTVTYGIELAAGRLPRLYLTTPLAYEQRDRDRAFFAGSMLGIVCVIGIALTAVFVANHRPIFPAAALVAWSVLAYLCVDFGFWNKLFTLRADDSAVYRAACEAAIAASLVIFLFAYLRVSQWHGFLRALFGLWILAQVGLVVGTVLEPRLMATAARLSFGVIASLGTLAIVSLAVRFQDRALSLMPTWLFLLVWMFGATMAVNGRLTGDAVVPGVTAGLVILVVLIGFTVTQFAFRAGGLGHDSTPDQLRTISAAVEGAGVAVWEWNARREEIKVSPFIEQELGLAEGELSRKVEDFTHHLHPADRDKFNLMLWSLKERSGGLLKIDFRLRKPDGTYRWFELEAASVPHADHRSLKCAGLMRDVTDAKRAHERLMHDAVHDSLTNLPNRELFLDRLGMALQRAEGEPEPGPIVLFIDLDRFKSVNSSFGLIVADSMLLTIARRLARHLAPQDTLARIGGDQFAILLAKPVPATELAMLAERVRRAIRSPMKISGKDIVLTCSIGIAAADGKQDGPHGLLSEAEAAMYRAKRAGSDRIEVFKPEMRGERDDRIEIESALRRALERRQIKIHYQPIIRFPTEDLAGFEALVRWQHPKLGLLNPSEFVPVAEQSDLIARLGAHVLERASADVARWLKELPREEDPLFVSVNVSSRQLFRQDLVTEIKHIIGRDQAPKGSIRLEVTESLVMENPEKAAEILTLLRQSGARLALDDFGVGYSSLSYLQRFPFDTIKIDRSLLRSAPDDRGGPLIVRSIVTLARELGKEVVAEGIETQEDVVYLRAIGCEYGQGYYYGEPMTDREVVELLRVIRKEEQRGKGWFAVRRRKKAAPAEEATQPQAEAAAPKRRRSPRAGNGTERSSSPQAVSPIAPLRAPPPEPPVPPYHGAADPIADNAYPDDGHDDLPTPQLPLVELDAV
ncbi:MAG: EAL domain-containing protein, partial [Hyphomicrobiaceae bacterium]